MGCGWGLAYSYGRGTAVGVWADPVSKASLQQQHAKAPMSINRDMTKDGMLRRRVSTAIVRICGAWRTHRYDQRANVGSKPECVRESLSHATYPMPKPMTAHLVTKKATMSHITPT